MSDDGIERTPEPGRRELERSAGLWPIRTALTVATAAALTGLALMMVGVLAMLGFPHLESAKSLPPNLLLDVLKFVLGTVAGVGALFALVMAYRRQRLAEDAHNHAQHDATERRVTELYTAAATQLGSDQAPVRLTALYTLERLANANPAHQQTIVNIICAYLRMPFTPPEKATPAEERRRSARRYHALRTGAVPADDSSPKRDPREELQVRRTAEDILSTHLSHDASDHWASIDLNLTGATLIWLDLEGSRLNSARFDLARLHGAAHFQEAHVVGDVSFVGAQISGGAFFSRARVGGDVTFSDAQCGGWGLFDDAQIGGDVYFRAAHFGRSPVFGAGNKWNGPRFDGTVTFERTQIRGDARFNRMEVGRTIVFRQMAVEGDLGLEGIRIDDRSEAHELPPGWRIDQGEGSTGEVVAETASGA